LQLAGRKGELDGFCALRLCRAMVSHTQPETLGGLQWRPLKPAIRGLPRQFQFSHICPRARILASTLQSPVRGPQSAMRLCGNPRRQALDPSLLYANNGDASLEERGRTGMNRAASDAARAELSDMTNMIATIAATFMIGNAAEANFRSAWPARPTWLAHSWRPSCTLCLPMSRLLCNYWFGGQHYSHGIWKDPHVAPCLHIVSANEPAALQLLIRWPMANTSPSVW
jgi:hypothetical protein